MCRRRVSPSPYLIIIIIPHPDTQVTQGCQIERPATGEPNMSSDTPGTKSHTINNNNREQQYLHVDERVLALGSLNNCRPTIPL